MTLFQKIVSFLDAHEVPYETKHHAPVTTSEEAAKARGESLHIGAKALLVKDDTHFVLLVLPAHCKLDTKKVKKLLKTRNLRFATAEELLLLADCQKGAVPPFGPLFGVEMLVDEKLFHEEWMAFNAGAVDTSIKMKTKDYLQVLKPLLASFSEYNTLNGKI